ncbi:MAG: lysophospholipid acyltransferase family protein [Pseudomonadota bacterium]
MLTALRTARIIGVIVVATFVLLPFHLVSLAFKLPFRKTIPVLWHRIVLYAFGMRVHVIGAPDTSRAGGLLLASNHSTWIDIVALGSVTPLSFIAKAEVRDWPIFGYLARWQETVFVTRERRKETKNQTESVRSRLDEGDTIVLFPEGTTSDGNFLSTFKSSLFGAVGITGKDAVEDGLMHTVQPVAICYVSWHGLPLGRYNRPLASWPGDIELVPHLKRVLAEGILDITISFGEPIEVDETLDRKDLCRRCEASVRDMLAASLRGEVLPSNAS